MFGSNGPVVSDCRVPSWAKSLVDSHLTGWTVYWHLIKKRKGYTDSTYGCCWSSRKVIEFYCTVEGPTRQNEWVLLHEIAHEKRGYIPKPSHRRNRICHDEKFFRIAAKLYLDYDPTLEVLRCAAKDEYKSGRHIMQAVLDNPEGFRNDVFGFLIEKKATTRRTFPSLLASGVTSLIAPGSKAWFKKNNGTIVTGVVTGFLRTRYRFLDMKNCEWKVPFEILKSGSPSDEAKANLLSLLKK